MWCGTTAPVPMIKSASNKSSLTSIGVPFGVLPRLRSVAVLWSCWITSTLLSTWAPTLRLISCPVMGLWVPSAIITRMFWSWRPAACSSSRMGGSSMSAGVSRVMSSMRTITFDLPVPSTRRVGESMGVLRADRTSFLGSWAAATARGVYTPARFRPESLKLMRSSP